MNFASVCHKGLVRDANEDTVKTHRLAHGALLAIVCDGMGGHRHGDVASQVAAATIGEEALNNYALLAAIEAKKLAAIEKELGAAISEANARVWREALNRRCVGNMGTTAVAAVVLVSGDFALAWAGDSRGYVVGETLEKPHWPHNYTGQLLRHGTLTDLEDALKGGQGQSILMQSLGSAPQAFKDDGGCETLIGRLIGRERLLLCSDGVWGEMPDETMRKAVHDAESVTTACSALLAAALNAGGRDNISAIVVENG